ncbi:MAG: AMP-binding protein [Alphaproteobacteria bacterium]|nr:AMP-binding protein [Alphaproteobacteria bacterium]
MSHVLQALAHHEPMHLALVNDKRKYTYGDLQQEISARASALSGVSALGLALDNSPDWILWDLACIQAGIPCIPIPPFFNDSQKAHSLKLAGVSHLLSPTGLAEAGFFSRKIPKNTAKTTFTSGTTGTPKGACLSLELMEKVAGSIFAILGDEFVGNHVCVLPLAVLLENVAGVYAGLIAGCTIHIPSLKEFGQNYKNIHQILKNNNATSAILVPEILRILMAQTALYGPLPRLKFLAVGGSKIDPELIVSARKMALPVYEGYGLSECASVVSLNTPHSDRIGSTGKILSHIEAKIKDGEIRIKNPGFLGYIGETAPAVVDTGDLGQIDSEGFLSITGRRKNILITSYGRNISPEWVESALLAQTAIAQAIVYGDEQPSLSALIVPSSPQADVQAAINFANQALPDYAQVKDFRIIPPFTIENQMLTGTGRPRREQILTLYTKEKSHEFLQQAG